MTSPTEVSATGSLELIAEGIWMLRSPMPVAKPHEVLTYLIEDASGDLHVVDPGWTTEDAWRALESAIASLGHSVADVASVAATHIHIDHFGLSHRLQQASGATVRLGAADIEVGRATRDAAQIEATLDAWSVPAERRDDLRPHFRAHPDLAFPDVQPLDGGELLPIPGRRVRAVATPGHTPGHHILVVEDDRVVLLGDHLLPDSFPGIGLGGLDDPQPIEHYLRSLALVAELDGLRACPGHERPFDGIAERVLETAGHHLRRTREVAAIVAEAPELTVWEAAQRVTWSQGFDGLRGVRLRSALAQVTMHAAFASTELGRRAIADGFEAFLGH